LRGVLFFSVFDPITISSMPDVPCEPMTIKSISFFLLKDKIPLKALSN
jgi:hypothetical protein